MPGTSTGTGTGTTADCVPAPVDVAAILDRIRPVVHITVPALAAAGRDDAGPAMLEDESPVPIDLAVSLCGQASQWTRVLTDPVTGAPVAADTYVPGRELRRAIQARDRTCRAPGCAIPAHRCDLDHTREWSRGGRTTPENLAALCRYHHRMRETGWRLAQPSPGVLDWTSPGGRVYRTSPERIAMVTGPPGTAPPPDRSPETPAPPGSSTSRRPWYDADARAPAVGPPLAEVPAPF